MEAAAEADAAGVVVGIRPPVGQILFLAGGTHVTMTEGIGLFVQETNALVVMHLMRARFATILLIFAALVWGTGTGTVSAADPPELTVTVVGVLKDSWRRGVRIRFENPTPSRIKILRPLDGSEWGWHMPYYSLSITDSTGANIPMGMRCGMSGLYSNLKWPDDYLIQILPHDAYEMTVALGRSIPAKGRYRVSFSYTYSSIKKAAREDAGIKYPGDLWTGTATSEPVDIELPESP